MGIIKSGILSGVSGKVAGVVGARWKDKYYLRAWVAPANPNTAAQQVQRTKFSDCVEFCKTLVGQVFNTYTDKFIKAMSGFNFFIKQNIDIFDGSPLYGTIKVTSGALSYMTNVVLAYATATITITWSKSLGNNGSDTDKVFACAYVPSTGNWYFPAAEVDRSTETIDIVAVSGLSPGDLHIYIWCAKYVGTVLDMISDNQHDDY